LFTFSAPSAVMAFPYAVGMAGFLGGSLICLVVTGASMGGSWMLLQMKLEHPSCHTFGALGGQVLGPDGKAWGDVIQLTNFILFLPCALRFCAEALAGVYHGIPGFNGCIDFHVFLVAGVCLATTQARTLSNTQIFTVLSACSIVVMIASILVATAQYDNPKRVPAQLFGNPEADAALSFIQFAGGFTICAWSYVPSFLTVELVGCMKKPEHFHRSILLSGGLNVVAFLAVGLPVVARWGYNVGEVVNITFSVAVWQAGNPINSVFNVFQLVGNFVSYMLDSVPLGRFCQQAWAPHFRDTWSLQDILRYLSYTLPTFIFALLAVVFVPSVNVLLDFATACTAPMVTQIYPAVVYWKFLKQPGNALRKSASVGRPHASLILIMSVFSVGCVSFFMCWAKAIGYVSMDELRPPMQIGCTGWLLYNSAPDDTP